MIDFYKYNPFAPMVDTGNLVIGMQSGDMPLMDLLTLNFLVNKVKKEGMVAYEIGSWTGMSTCCIADAIKGYGKLFAVDNFKGSNESQSRVLGYINIREILEKNLDRFGVKDVVTVLEMSSNDCVVPDKSIDFLFIDGDHRYTQFKRDLDTWLPRIKDDGIICGHDFDGIDHNDEYIEIDAFKENGKHHHHGVSKALKEKFGAGGFCGIGIENKSIGSIWVHEGNRCLNELVHQTV